MDNQTYPKFLNNRLVRHGIFWSSILFFFTVPPSLGRPDLLGWQLIMNLCYTPLDMFAVYITLYALLPGILNRKRIVINSLLYIGLLVSIAGISNFLEEHVITFIPQELVERNTIIIEYFRSVMMLNMIIGVAVGIKLAVLWYQEQLKNQEITKRQAQTELAQLREQLNPHFLFNTLNNIDTLVLQDPGKASETLIRLSDILRYSIYEASENLVALDKELEYLENYVSLQRIRINKPDFVEFHRTGSGSGLRISPMLMIPLVENAFKHSYKHGDGSGIHIEIIISGTHFSFITRNRCKPANTKETSQLGGIGIQNVKRRLELQYPNHYQFENSLTAGWYTCILQLTLT